MGGEGMMREHVQSRVEQAWALRPPAAVYGGEGGSWDNHFLSWQSGCLSAAPAHGSLGSSMPSCFAPVSALGFLPQMESEGVLRERQKEGRRRDGGEGRGGVREERTEERERMWPEPWVLAKLPSLSYSSFPPLPLNPSPAASLHNGRFSAEISRYWIPGLEFCPPTMSRQRSMLQGRHTLQAKSWKTIPPFISIRKGEKSSPLCCFFFSLHHPFSSHVSPVSKPEEGCQARSSFTGPHW